MKTARLGYSPISRRQCIPITLAVIGTLSAALFGARADVASAPTLLVLNKSDNTLAIIDATTLKVLGHVGTGVGPHEVTASADGKTAYVANYGDRETVGHTLSIIDLTTRKETRLELGDLKRPHGIAEKNGYIYFTSEVKKCVARYNPQLGKVDWTAQTDQNTTHMLVPSPDGKRLYTANILSDTISILDIATGKATHVNVGSKPEGLDISPDGKELWVGHDGDGGVSVIDTEAGKVTQTLAVSKVPIRIKFTPDGQRVLISDPERGELYIYGAKTRKEIQRIPVGMAAVGIAISTDGRRAFVASMAENKVSVIDLTSLKITDRIEPGGMPDGLAWVEPRANNERKNNP